MQSPHRLPRKPLLLRSIPPEPLVPSYFFFRLQSSVHPVNVSFKTFSLQLCGSATEQDIGDLDNLPVAITRSGKVSRYVWDGSHLELLGIEGGGMLPFVSRFIDVGNLWIGCCSVARDFFIPKQVSDNYIGYVKWKFLHRVFSSALQVLATQAMFRAIGVGHAKSLPSAAALNWALKDGLGRLSRCIYTASVGSAFDTNLKRVRLATSVMFSLGIAVELMTPKFPHCFLLLASVANIAKQISLACHLATCSAVHRSFAVADNLGEVSAKAQIQTVCFDNLGLLLAALLNIICKNDLRWQAGLPYVVFPVFSAMDLLGIHQALKHVHLQTLTKDRLEIILSTWVQLRYVPSPAEVSRQEDINLLKSPGKEQWPIRIGTVNVKMQIPILTVQTMKSLCNEDFYFISLETCLGLTRKRKRIVLCLRDGVPKVDIIRGLLQACYVREFLSQNRILWDNILENEDSSNSLRAEWSRVMKESKSKVCARGEVNMLYKQMMEMGWAVNSILLSGSEQTRYTFLNDKGI